MFFFEYLSFFVVVSVSLIDDVIYCYIYRLVSIKYNFINLIIFTLFLNQQRIPGADSVAYRLNLPKMLLSLKLQMQISFWSKSQVNFYPTFSCMYHYRAKSPRSQKIPHPQYVYSSLKMVPLRKLICVAERWKFH